MTDNRFRPRVVLRGAQSGGAVAVVEITAPPPWAGPPLHHHAFAEAFYVLEGELPFQLGDELRIGRPGSFAFARGGDVHTLANHSDTPARYLLTITPPGLRPTSIGSPPRPRAGQRPLTTATTPRRSSSDRRSAPTSTPATLPALRGAAEPAL